MRLVFLLLIFASCTYSTVSAQSINTDPVVGLRDSQASAYALTGANIVIRPGEVISDGIVLVEDGYFVEVGRDIAIPSRFQRIPCDGKFLYPAFIDAWSEQSVEFPQSSSGYWNQNIVPHRRVIDSVTGAEQADQLRKQGFAARLVAPQGGILKGTSHVYLLGGLDRTHRMLSPSRWHHAQLTVPRYGPRESYPNSPMGATALLRQAFYDAKWYTEAKEAHGTHPGVAEPEFNLALETLSNDRQGHWFVFDAPNERMAVRADGIATEFSLKIALRGSGREYRDVEALASMNRPFLIPVDFPSAPNVKDAQAQEGVTLQDLLHWDLAPTNPARLHDAKIKFCLTTDGLDNPSSFLPNVRQAIICGLDAEAALAAMTTVPAELLGINEELGSIEKGKLASFSIMNGEFSSETTKVEECWVAGERYEFVESKSEQDSADWESQWVVRLPEGKKRHELRVRLVSDKGSVTGSVFLDSDQPEAKSRTTDKTKASSKKRKLAQDKQVDLKTIQVERDRISGTVELEELGLETVPGLSLITILHVPSIGQVSPDDVTLRTPVLNLRLPDGVYHSLPMTPFSGKDDQPRGEKAGEGEDVATSDSESVEQEKPDLLEPTDTPILKPLGAYGLSEPVKRNPRVVFRKATIWTCGESGNLSEADLLIEDGLIVAIGTDLSVPANTLEIDLSGKHLTPGLIDCHSHMGTDGGVNESGQVVTSEVRIGDFIDNSDINIYRQLAGGLTVSNILHGSANPIGGQNQVIKLRWGDSMENLKMQEAPAGIKFALGENVKRNQSRYPNTRMGVEQILRDQLLAAREYDVKWRRWNSGIRDGLPPRVDLQLKALAEVQNGKRWIHCHSYRQDEIVATLSVLEEFGIQIGTLQHILEGYKVADRIKQHGAMASAFSDWWAYKFEVFDAIPYNGAIMHNQGVVVSFNSDDRELARHLNTEAAKATKYGAIPESEALKFVTLNPAKQLRIDHVVGSIEIGKHADLAVWSGRPLSTLSRCEQTWVDGIRYFDLNEDQQLRERDRMLRSRLIQKAMKSEPAGRVTSRIVQEEERWVRKDIYCAVHGGLRHENAKQEDNQ